MILERFYLNCLSHASYLLGDEETRIAAIIDPQRDIDIYLQEAEARDLKIKYVILTHFHADFVAGHLGLRDKVGATIVLGAKAQAEFDFHALGDGDVIEFGQVKLVGMETPGHTPEGLTVLAYDLAKDAERPHAAFTGDTLFIGDVGRPDLMASIGVTAEELGNMLYDSIHEKLAKLPDSTLVYPAHGAGSLCGKTLGEEAFSTIGEQKKFNYAMQPMSRESFLTMVTTDQPDAPDYFLHDAMMNRAEHATLEAAMSESLQPMSLDEVLRLQSEGAQVVDTREPVDFAAGHLKNSVNVGIDGKYATWAGTVLDKQTPIVVIADEDRVDESVMRLGRIGFDQVRGFLKGGVEALEGHTDQVESTQRITALAVNELSEPYRILDVRAEKERQAGMIEGSQHIPLTQLQKRLDEVPRDQTIVVHCAGGYRSSIAASLLQRAGLHNVMDLVGGFAAWEAFHQDAKATS